MTRRPRFIAGAVCARCGAVDRTVLVVEEAVRERRCVACGFAQTIHEDDAAPLPAGRLARRALTAEAATQVVRVAEAPDPSESLGPDSIERNDRRPR